MEDFESTASVEPNVGRQRELYGEWARLFAEGAAFQAALARGLAEATIESAGIVQRQYAALAEAWMRAASGMAGQFPRPASGPAGQSTADDRSRGDVDVSRTAGAEPTAESPTGREQPVETAHESEGAPIPAGTGPGETSGRGSAERAEPAPSPGEEGLQPDADVDQLEALEPEDAEQLRSADVHTVEELATAEPEELADETELEPRRARWFVVRARRVRRNW